ncbi:hypothetical protein [Streptomyces noursei]|uniref:hypothetical protein n=1 Tax=Streptomyces noursei TaxID=1971 RepID=UPI0008297179
MVGGPPHRPDRGGTEAEPALPRTAHAAGVPVPGVRFGGRAPAEASGGTGSRHRFELGRSRMAGDAPELVRPGP